MIAVLGFGVIATVMLAILVGRLVGDAIRQVTVWDRRNRR